MHIYIYISYGCVSCISRVILAHHSLFIPGVQASNRTWLRGNVINWPRQDIAGLRRERRNVPRVAFYPRICYRAGFETYSSV